MTNEQTVYPLEGVIQHYAWGGTDFIPHLIGKENPPQEPHAELWMGVHHGGPARVQNGQGWLLLEKLIEEAPEKIVGSATFRVFGPHLPYLFKILDVKQMLSIQAHPSKEQAEAGFKEENERGVPLDAPDRNYKDANHKPEVMVALTGFWLLHGFLTAEKMAERLSGVPELEAVSQYFENHDRDIQALYRWVMEMPQTQIDELLVPLRERLAEPYRQGNYGKEQPEFWAARAFGQFRPAEGMCDRGILSIFLMNIVQIAAGQGIYQDAGVLHAYLEGVNVELMASSDNVFRGGLTVKHVNVSELMKNISFQPVIPQIIQGEERAQGITAYPTPAPDFELCRLKVSPEQPIGVEATSPETLIVIEGNVVVNGVLNRRRGECFFIPAGAQYELSSEKGAVLFRAGVPV